jgi:hypothetical protein
LLIPAQVSTLSQSAPAGAELPWYLAWLNGVAAPAQAAAPPEADDLPIANSWLLRGEAERRSPSGYPPTSTPF